MAPLREPNFWQFQSQLEELEKDFKKILWKKNNWKSVT